HAHRVARERHDAFRRRHLDVPSFRVPHDEPAEPAPRQPQDAGETIALQAEAAFAMRSPTSVVPIPILPAERLLIFFVASASITAASIRAAAFASPSWSSIIAPERIAASGLMTFWFVYLGALPPMGSNIETLSGLMLPPAAI